MKKSVSLILSILTLCSMTACTIFPSGNSESDGSSQQSTGSDIGDNVDYTDYKLVDNGKSEYKIVLPTDASYDEEIAALEMEELFAEAASITLETVYESEVTYSETAKLIILGDTQYTGNTGVDVDAIPNDGFTVKTVGSNLFVLGEDSGVIYGVHEFLEKALGFEYYVADVYALNKNVKDLYMPKLDISDAPDIEYRADAWGAEKSEQGTYRARLRSFNGAFMSRGMYHVHNTLEWLPTATYMGEHPDWYSNGGGQICYTAHGNETELEAMQNLVLEKFKEQVNYYFGIGDYRDAISFTQQEGTTGGWCACAACTKDVQTYGATSASIIRFLNPIAKEFKAWLAEEYPGHEITIVFFAYQKTQTPPVKEENGKFVPTHESVVLEDGLAVWLAPIYGDYSRSITDEKNQDTYNLFKKWAVLTKKFYVWGYDTNFNNYLMWYDSFNALPDLYKYLNEFNVKYMFNQGQIYSNSNRTAFDSLKVALNYKLMWDADTDVEAFTDRFFKTWFGEAAEPMKLYYDSFINWSEKIKTEQNYDGSIYFEENTSQHYPLKKLTEWQGYIQAAYESIESLQEKKPNRYNNLSKRINAESIAIRYALIGIHSESYSQDELWEMLQSFKEDATKLGFTRWNEWSAIDVLWNSWGV